MKYGKKITIEKVYNDEVQSVVRIDEESISIINRAELAKELLDCAERVIDERTPVEIKLEPATNNTYLVRLVKTREIKEN